MKNLFFVFFVIFLTCSKDDTLPTSEMYFPPAGSSWEKITPASLGWNEAAIPDLKSFLTTSNSRALIVLKDGKIVIEEYVGTQLTGGAFTATSNWYWASAGKTLTSSLVGIANSQGKINFAIHLCSILEIDRGRRKCI